MIDKNGKIKQVELVPPYLRFFKGIPPFGEKRTHHVHVADVTHPKNIEEYLLCRANESGRNGLTFLT